MGAVVVTLLLAILGGVGESLSVDAAPSIASLTLQLVAFVTMVAITASFFALLFGIFVTFPLLLFLIYAHLDHVAVCIAIGLLCAGLIVGLPSKWDAFQMTILISGACAGLGAWWGSRPNGALDTDAQQRRSAPPSRVG